MRPGMGCSPSANDQVHGKETSTIFGARFNNGSIFDLYSFELSFLSAQMILHFTPVGCRAVGWRDGVEGFVAAALVDVEPALPN